MEKAFCDFCESVRWFVFRLLFPAYAASLVEQKAELREYEKACVKLYRKIAKISGTDWARSDYQLSEQELESRLSG